MPNDVSRSLFDLLDRSPRVLVVTRARPSVDGAATALAWATVLEREGHSVAILVGGGLPPALSFLPRSGRASAELAAAQPLVIDVDAGGASIASLRYEVKDGNVSIYLTPKSGSLAEAKLTTAPGPRPFDLILSLDAPQRESWGEPFSRHRELLLHAPTATIDRHPAHSRYGQLNVVDVAAPALAALTWQLLGGRPAERWLDPEVATCLYAGVVSATDRFTSSRVTPQLLEAAGQMLAAGANRDAVMANLYRNRNVSTLRLWGTALARLEWDQPHRLAWTSLTRSDLVRAGDGEEQLNGMLDELVATSPHAEIAALFYERTPEETSVWLAAARALDALTVSRPFSPTGDADVARFTVPEPLPQARERVLDHLRQALATALS